MTPQSFSYGTVSKNGMIYMPPYGLSERIDYMLKLNPSTYEISRIHIPVDNSYEKWIVTVIVENKIFVLPYNESAILVIDTETDYVERIELGLFEKGKFSSAHLYNNKIYALPFGIDCEFNTVLIFDIEDYSFNLIDLNIPVNNEKKWHTTQLLGNTIYGVPRGELTSPYFSYIIEFNCDTNDYKLTDIGHLWKDVDKEGYASAKYTTLAKSNNKLYAPPYCRNPNFDLMAIMKNNQWSFFSTGQKSTSRKYYTHIVAQNGKIYFPPAGHDEDWSELMIVDSHTDKVSIRELGIGKESKKYFAGCENSKGKIFWIPRGGCVCMPKDQWKEYGDLTEILVLNTEDDTTYTIDVSEYYDDCTTIEKYNNCVIVDDKIFALPYGESETFQDILVFDTVTEKVIKKVNLNDV